MKKSNKAAMPTASDAKAEARKAKAREWTGSLAQPLRRLPASFGMVTGKAALGLFNMRYGILNEDEIAADKIRQQLEKLPDLCAALDVEHGAPGWELKLAIAAASADKCPGFDYPPQGLEPGEGYAEMKALQIAEFREIVRVLAVKGCSQADAIGGAAAALGRSPGSVKSRLYKYGKDDLHALETLGAQRLNLLQNGALHSFSHVAPKLAREDGAPEPVESIGGILAFAALQMYSPRRLIHIFYSAEAPTFAKFIRDELERCSLVSMTPLHASHIEPETKTALYDECKRFRGWTIIIDKPGNMQDGAALSDCFAAAGISPTADINDHGQLPGVPVYPATGRFAGIPTPCIITLGKNIPKQIREYDGPYIQPHREWFFGSALR